MTITRRCMMCGSNHSMEFEESVISRFEHRRENGEYVQDIVKDSTAAEFLLSGMCPKCQKSFFASNED